MSSVQITFTGEDRDLLQAFQRQQAEILKNQRALIKMGDAGTDSSDRTVRGMQGVNQSIAIATQAYGFLTQAVTGWMEANEQAIAKADEAAKKWDDQSRKFAVQSGLRGLQADQAQQRIEKIAYDRGTKPDQANDIATQLVSSGFSVEEASGPSLDAFLKVLNAANASGGNVDSAQLAEAMGKYIESQGQELNADSINRFGQQGQTAFKNTNFQLGDFQDLAKVGATLAAGISPEEQIATHAVLKGILPSAEAATAEANFVSRLQTARETPSRVAALRRMGLKPGDVDFIDENMDQVLERMDRGLQSVPEEERAGLMKMVFEESGVTPARHLIANRQKLQKVMQQNQDNTGFLSDVAYAESGTHARDVRQDIRIDQLDRAESQFDSDVADEMEIHLRERGASPWRAWGSKKLYGLSRSLGVSPELSLQVVPGIGHEESGEIQGAAGSRMVSPQEMDNAAKQIKEMAVEWRKTMEENTRATDRNTRGAGGASPTVHLGRSN